MTDRKYCTKAEMDRYEVEASNTAIKRAVEKIEALRKLSRESGVITTRTQSKILQALTEYEMTVVAETLAAQTEVSRG